MWFYIYKSILPQHKFSLLVNFVFTAQFVFLIFRICMSSNLHVSAQGDLRLFGSDAGLCLFWELYKMLCLDLIMVK